MLGGYESLFFLLTSRINLDSQKSISDTVSSQKVVLKGSSSDRSLVFLETAHSLHAFTAQFVPLFSLGRLRRLRIVQLPFPLGMHTQLALAEVTVVEAKVTDEVAVTDWLAAVST